MADDVIIVPDRAAIERIDASRPRLIGETIERRTRHVEMQRVKRLVDHVAWVGLEIVEIGRAGVDVRFLDVTALLPDLAFRIVAQLQADEIGIFLGERAGKTRHRIVVACFRDRDLGAAQRARHQRGRRFLEAEEFSEPFAVGACPGHHLSLL